MSHRPDALRPTILAVLDGWGLSSHAAGNAIRTARTPVMDRLWRTRPHASLDASGLAVGLPRGQEGNSEAGHLNIGAGRVVLQESVRITRSIKDGTFAKNPAFTAAIQHVRRHTSRLHLMGILTDGPSTHTDPTHLYALLDLVHRENIQNVSLHLFTDGRDAPQHMAAVLIKRLKERRWPEQRIATLAGRFYLDRKKRWATTEQIYHALVTTEGVARAPSTSETLTRAYNLGFTDEFVPPTIIAESPAEAKRSRIHDNDAVIFFNFRSDRARQLTKAFVQTDFNKQNPESFRRKAVRSHLRFVAMTDFGPDLGSVLTAFPSTDLTDTLPMQFHGLRQLYIAETEKYAHITFFFNGGYSAPVAGEERVLIPSPTVSSYATKPAMSAAKITATVVRRVRGDGYAFVALNYANADMIGHTGDFAATVRGVEVVDRELGKLEQFVRDRRGMLVIVGDHGNAEVMMNTATGEPVNEHTTNPVPCIVVGAPPGSKLRPRGKLADVAPTVLDLVGLTKPAAMTGRSLVIRPTRRRSGPRTARSQRRSRG